MTGTAEHFAVFAHIQLFERGTGGTEIFAGVEFSRFFVENFTDGSGHCQTAVRVDVDFANRALGSFAELIFTDTDGIFELSAVFIDDFDQILRHAGRTVQNDGESGDLFFDFSEDVQADFRIVAGLEFVSTVAGTDGDGEGVHTGAADEVNDLFRAGIGVGFGFYVILDTGENAEFTLR